MWQSVEGYVIIQIEGAGVERLLNRLQAAGIPVRDVARSGRGVCRCRLRPRDFRRLHALCGGCRCRVRILRRGGLPIRMARLMRRQLHRLRLPLSYSTSCLSARLHAFIIKRFQNGVKPHARFRP